MVRLSVYLKKVPYGHLFYFLLFLLLIGHGQSLDLQNFNL